MLISIDRDGNVVKQSCDGFPKLVLNNSFSIKVDGGGAIVEFVEIPDADSIAGVAEDDLSCNS